MNPTGQPMAEPPPNAAREQVNAPAIVIIVVAALGLLYSVYAVVRGDSIPPGALDDAKLTVEMKELVVRILGLMRYFSLFGLLLNGLIIYGALQMRQLKSYTWAMVSAVLVMLPCMNWCCLLGLGAGIWA